MTRSREPIREWDLQAYADGLLERDPARKREVESWLREKPHEASRISTYRAQNAMLVDRYGDVVDEPVPERLYRALEGGIAARGFARAAAVAGVMLASGALGWWIGQYETPPIQPGGHLMALLTEAGRPALATAGEAVGDSRQVQPLTWLSEKITIPLHSPDLTALGYTNVGKRLIESNGGQAVQLVYARPDGKRVVLLLAPRWEEEEPRVRLVEREGLRIAYGFEGPVGYGVAGDLDEDAIRRVAEAVRRSWHEASAVNSAAVSVERNGLAPTPVGPLSAPVSIGGPDSAM